MQKQTAIRAVQLTGLCIVFLGFHALQGALPLAQTGLKGLLSQFNVVITLYLVVRFEQTGYAAAVILNVFQTISVSLMMVTSPESLNALPGAIIPLTAVLVARLVRNSNLTLSKRNDEILRQKVRLEEQAGVLRQMAYADRLTDALNLQPFLQEMTEAFEKAKASTSPFAVMVLSVENLQSINDRMGHTMGDKVLKQVATQLRLQMHEGDCLARIAFEAFALLAQAPTTVESMRTYGASLLLAVRRIQIGIEVKLDTHIGAGVAFGPADAENAECLLHCADIARAYAQDRGERIVFYTAEMLAETNRRVSIENRLRTALENEEFSMVYQPQYRISDHQMIGMEALLRWHSPEFGEVSPSLFIAIAEHSGLIEPIGSWALKEACRQFMQFRQRLRPGVCLSVNLSPVQLANDLMIGEVKRALADSGLPSNLLTLEITESTLVADMDRTAYILKGISRLGVKIALDDFGKGYSSLHYLQEMCLNTLKIDKDYISAMDGATQNRILVSTIITMGHQMGYQVIAEGVETPEQLQMLRELGCDSLQGFLWGKPAPMAHWLTEEDKR